VQIAAKYAVCDACEKNREARLQGELFEVGEMVRCRMDDNGQVYVMTREEIVKQDAEIKTAPALEITNIDYKTKTIILRSPK